MERNNKTIQYTNNHNATKSKKINEMMKKDYTSNYINAVLVLFNIIIVLYATFRPFDKEKFIVESANELTIGENWGNIYFNQYINIRNTGKKVGTITSIEGLIVSIDNPSFYPLYISAKNYGYEFRGSYNIPIINISLYPNEVLTCYFQLFKELSKEHKESIVNYQAKCHDVIEKRKFMSMSDSDDSYYYYGSNEIDSTTYLEIKQFVLERIKNFTEGKYQYIVSLNKNNEKEPFEVKCYDFVIYKSDLYVLEEGVNNYKEGWEESIYYRGKRQDQITVKLTPISKKETMLELREKLKTMNLMQ